MNWNREALIRLYEHGFTYADIGKMKGVSKQGVAYWFNKLKIPRRKPGPVKGQYAKKI